MSVLSVDPGDRSGWALWSDDGVLRDHGILEADEMLQLLAKWPDDWRIPSKVVFEDYRLQRGRAIKQAGSTMKAVQIIGALRMFAKQHHATTHSQEIGSRDLGYMHSGMKKATNHANSHDLDAIAHGYWFFETQHIVPNLELL